MTLLCKYANIAGEPGTGVHQTRFLGMAAFDLFGTIMIAIVLTFVFAQFTSTPWFLTLLMEHRKSALVEETQLSSESPFSYTPSRWDTKRYHFFDIQ